MSFTHIKSQHLGMKIEINQHNIAGSKKESDHDPIKSERQGKRHNCKSQWRRSLQEEDYRDGFY